MRQKNKLFQICTVVLIIFLSGCSFLEERESDSYLRDRAVPLEPFVPSEKQKSSDGHQTSPSPQGQSPLWTPLMGCEEKEKVTFTSLPLEFEKITAVEPQGELTGFKSGHVTPGDHVGFRYDHTAPAMNVYALADGYLVRVERNPGYFGIGGKNYHLYVEYSCSLFGSYVHVIEIASDLLQADPKFKELDSLADTPKSNNNLLVRIPLKAGQAIGKTEIWGLLGMLTVDTSVTLSGFENPKIYSGEPWKTHAVPPFDYFSDSLKEQIMAKNPRTKEPRGGKIDFDQPGKLVGNWFREGTDYAGDRSKPFCGDYICPYWESHLSFVYDYVDPLQIRVGIGYNPGLTNEGPYGVKSNSPDPKDITPEKGLVKYELVKLNDLTAAKGYPAYGKPLITENSDELLGTMLIQMTGENKLKMEFFPGKTAAQVQRFTNDAMVYGR